MISLSVDDFIICYDSIEYLNDCGVMDEEETTVHKLNLLKFMIITMKRIKEKENKHD